MKYEKSKIERDRVGAMEGPRGLKERELASAAKLANAVFRSNSPYKMEEEYPLLFSKKNLEDMLVFIDAGEVVSLVGMSIRDTSIMGCKIRVASIGSVCTDPKYRKRGLATRLMKEATKRAIGEGADVMLVSGGRGLYRRLGCINAGLYRSYYVRKDQLRSSSEGLNLRRYREEDVADMVKLHQSEPVRFIRPYGDFKELLAAKRLCDQVSETYLITSRKRPLAYVCLQLPRARDKPLAIKEFAGSRTAILRTLKRLMEEIGTESAVIDTPSVDTSFEYLMSTIGARKNTRGFMGTVKLINTRAFLQHIDTYITEVLGTDTRRNFKISYNSKLSRLSLNYMKQRLSISGIDKITAFIFGSIEVKKRIQPEGLDLRNLLDMLFPMPLVDYGLNFV